MKKTLDEIISIMKENLVTIQNGNTSIACDSRGCMVKIVGKWEFVTDDFAKGIIHSRYDFFANEIQEIEEDILEYKKSEEIEYEVKCNMCEWKGMEEDLLSFEDKDGRGFGCPNCKVDYYLMNIEKKEGDEK